MNLGKYIHELLLDNETVIIPGFGAFISNYKSAEVNTETDELKPPTKEISFNAQVRNNDGLLVGRVADGEDVSHFEALKLIEKERENLVYQLDKGELIVLEETGELSNNADNDIQFKPYHDDNLLLDSYGLESVSLSSSTEKEKIPVSEEKVADNNEPETKEEETVSEEEEVEVEEKAKSKTKKKLEEIYAEPIVWDTNLQEEEGELLESLVDPDKKPEVKEKKNRRWLLLLLILIPVIMAGVYFVIQNAKDEPTIDKLKKGQTSTIQKEPVISKEDLIPKDTARVETPEKVDSVIQPEKKPVKIEEAEGPMYYLVSGSFKDEDNALEYIKKLEDKGTATINLGKRGNFFIVAIDKYKTVNEAIAAKKEFDDKNPDSGIWIHKQ